MKHTLAQPEGMASTERLRAQLPASKEIIDIEAILGAVRRQWLPVAVMVILCLCAGAAYLYVTPPRYSSSTSLLIDSNNQKLVDQLSSAGGMLTDDSFVLNQVELLHSDKIIRMVIAQQKLLDDPYFKKMKPSLSTVVLAYLRKLTNSSDSEPVTENAIVEQATIETLARNLTVERVGRSSVLTLSYTSTDPKLSARIAEGFAEAYLSDQIDARYDATRRAGDWLSNRLEELRRKSLASDLAVQKFKAEHGLLATNGQLVSDQQLTRYNSLLMEAESDTAAALAKLNRIRTIITTNDVGAAVSDSLQSSVMNELRQDYLTASRREAEISGRYGANHVQAVRLRAQMVEYQRSMLAELTRIEASYQSEYDVAVKKQDSLKAQVTQATDVSEVANDSQVQLRELDREAQTYRALYETFLGKYQESVQQQSFPVTEARIIAAPQESVKPSGPKKTIVLVGFAAFGILLGGAIGGLREYRDRFYRTGDQITDLLDTEFLGYLPKVKGGERIPRGSERSELGRLTASSAVMNYVAERPLSSFAEVIRGVKLAVDHFTLSKACRTIGIVSVLPGEGKSSLSVNFAQLLASQGSRVVLIDGDLRKPSATSELAPHAEKGLIEALRGECSVAEVLRVDAETKLAFLPTIVKRRIPYSAELLSGPEMHRILEQLKPSYDYIIFDLPPLGPVIDARAISGRLDAYVLAIEWGKTPRGLVRRSMQINEAVAAKCCGAVLTKVDMKKIGLYHPAASPDFSSRYKSYYIE